MTVEITDPALVTSQTQYPPAASGSQRYFQADDGGIDYTIVARDLVHAKQILRESGAEFGDPAVPFDQAELEWSEVSEASAAEIRVHTDDRRDNPWALSTFRPGDWFCSEW